MIEPTWQTDDGTVKLWLGDCLEVMQSWSKFDVLVTDPPYGIGEAAGKNKTRVGSLLGRGRDYGDDSWDDEINQLAVDMARSWSSQQVIFGGNYYELPPASCWLVWDKMNGRNDFADCELAWTNLKRAVRQIRYRWLGMIRDGKDERGLHPTQKPVEVMGWAIEFTEGKVVADPFMGSGTTGVAAVSHGREFWGVEQRADYFEIAKRRLIGAIQTSKCSFGL